MVRFSKYVAMLIFFLKKVIILGYNQFCSKILSYYNSNISFVLAQNYEQFTTSLKVQ